jgi:hypothetical protein
LPRIRLSQVVCLLFVVSLQRVVHAWTVSTTFACRLGRHDWATEMRRLDDVEAARPIEICRRCGKSRPGQLDFGRGSASDTGRASGAPDMGGGGDVMGGF